MIKIEKLKPGLSVRVFRWAYSILMFLPFVLVFIFYNYYSLDFVMYAGWVILISGTTLIFLAGHEFKKKGRIPPGKSIVHTTVLVDSGVYSVIRHPQYLGFTMLVLAVVMMSQHWLSVLSGITGSIFHYSDTRNEERANIAKFGAAYKQYMQEVPGMNFLLGITRLARRRK